MFTIKLHIKRALIILLLAPIILIAQGVNVREERIKAACIYHISKFVNWPNEPKEEFIICANKESDTFDYLEDTFKNKKKTTARYRVEDLVEYKDLNKCNLIFVGDNKIDKLSNFSNKNSLLVSSSKSLFSHLIPIAIYKTKNKIAINIKLDTLKEQGYQVSSELLRIAVIK